MSFILLLNMIIYCNGDSFTQGHGLGDHIIPGYPVEAGNSPAGLAWTRESYKGTIRHELREAIDREEVTNRWSTKLAELSGLTVINAAQAGGSCNRTSRTTICDLERIRKTDPDVVAVIGISSIFRRELFFQAAWWSIQMTLADTYVDHPELSAFCRLHIENDPDDYSGLVNWYLSMIQIKDYCKNNHIPVLWVDSCMTAAWPVELDKYADLILLREYSAIEYDVIMNTLPFKGMKHVADGHFSSEIHQLTAEALNIKISKLQGK